GGRGQAAFGLRPGMAFSWARGERARGCHTYTYSVYRLAPRMSPPHRSPPAQSGRSANLTAPAAPAPPRILLTPGPAPFVPPRPSPTLPRPPPTPPSLPPPEPPPHDRRA